MRKHKLGQRSFFVVEKQNQVGASCCSSNNGWSGVSDFWTEKSKGGSESKRKHQRPGTLT